MGLPGDPKAMRAAPGPSGGGLGQWGRVLWAEHVVYILYSYKNTLFFF